MVFKKVEAKVLFLFHFVHYLLYFFESSKMITLNQGGTKCPLTLAVIVITTDARGRLIG